MSATFVCEDDRINYLNNGTAAIERGEVVYAGEMVGIALGSIAVGEMGVLKTNGLWDVDALSTATFNVGSLVYFDKTNKQCVAVKADTTPIIGYAVEAKAAGETTVQIKLRPE